MNKTQSKKRIEQVVAAIAAAKTVWELWNIAKHAVYDYRARFTLSIAGDDRLYPAASAWLADHFPNSDLKNMEVETYLGGYRDNETKIRSMYAGSKQSFRLDGHLITVDIASALTEGMEVTNSNAIPDRFKVIKFYCQKSAAREVLLAKLEELVQGISNTPTQVVTSGKSYWQTYSNLQFRNLESVILPDSQKERIIDDVKKFLASREAYANIGIPYHRGYLLYGPPGTGKTSLVSAIASHFKRDVYILSLSDLEGDCSLINMLTSIEDGSILLLEDIDALAVSHERDAVGDRNGSGITSTGLLNALDGISTPDGLITMMTTNHVERLDPALLRSGRIDVKEEIGYLTVDQLDRLFMMFYNEPLGIRVESIRPVPACDMVDIMKTRMGNPDEARFMIGSLLR